jgi:hypothetical protein
VEDFAALLDAHDCAGGACSRGSHTQLVLVSPDDVAAPADEITMLLRVRDGLAERGFTMLETEPTPRFDATLNSEPKPWAVNFEPSLPGSPGTETGGRRATRFAVLRKFW